MLDRLLASDAIVYTILAAAGATVFLFKLSLMMLGGVADGMDGDLDADFSADAPGELDGLDPHDSTASFHLLSLQSLAAFAMGFGTGGLAARVTFGWSTEYAVLAGFIFGAFVLWLIAMGMKLIYSLHSSGNVNPSEAVGLDGVAQTTVPEGRSGRGRVRVVIRDRMREYNAITEGDSIPSHTPVRVTRVESNHTLVVTSVSGMTASAST